MFWKKRRKQKVFYTPVCNVVPEKPSASSHRTIAVPDANAPVHAAGDQQAVLATEVKGLDASVDGENSLVALGSHLWGPPKFDLLYSAFITDVSDVTQPLLDV